MDFAPYQDTSPDQQRALSPPRRSLSRSPEPRDPTQKSSRNIADTLSQPLPNPDRFASPSGFGSDDLESGGGGNGGGSGGGLLGNRSHVNLFETSLPMRLDYEAIMAYVLLPPAGAVFLLLVEHKSDYVRFHAWQSSLIFSLTFVLHLIFTFSQVVSFILLAIDIVMILFLSMRAYQDADTLDRFEMPYFGALASAWVDAE